MPFDVRSDLVHSWLHGLRPTLERHSVTERNMNTAESANVTDYEMTSEGGKVSLPMFVYLL